MFDELLSNLDSDKKLEIAKYASVFAGGVLVGYSLKKVLDSYDMDVIKENAMNMVDDYINPKSKYPDFEKETIDDEDKEE